jgi:hypothetical protein
MHQPNHAIHVPKIILIPNCKCPSLQLPFNNQEQVPPLFESTQADTTKTHLNDFICPLHNTPSCTKAKKVQKITLSLNSKQ